MALAMQEPFLRRNCDKSGKYLCNSGTIQQKRNKMEAQMSNYADKNSEI